MLSNEDRTAIIFTRYFLEDDLDARMAAKELAAIPGFTLDGHYHWLGPIGGLEQKFNDLRAALEALGFNPPAA